jgi:hypothetical protein
VLTRSRLEWESAHRFSATSSSHSQCNGRSCSSGCRTLSCGSIPGDVDADAEVGVPRRAASSRCMRDEEERTPLNTSRCACTPGGNWKVIEEKGTQVSSPAYSMPEEVGGEETEEREAEDDEEDDEDDEDEDEEEEETGEHCGGDRGFGERPSEEWVCSGVSPSAQPP